ncbi:MAG: hypothetical protein EZS28_010580 [Streblomastix strix]|uniref:Uncharacterized protein n=1 Tax=Streblomastix strix TaxID=222440 RepID=A0A5J4WGV6_9EUKA|nr:MAG: hypothetical protein EZS28_010580 [Streblomastix strix]
MQSISLSPTSYIQTFRICDVNVLIGSLELLRHLPFESTPFVEKLFLFPQFGNSLMNLMRFERNKGNKQKIQQMIDEHLSLRIRHLSLQTLSSIQWAGGPNVQNQLILQNGYVNELIQCIGNGGGSFESNKRIIINSLESLRSIFTLLSDGESWCPSQKQLIKSCEEIIEPESGIEEIETHLFHIDQSVGKWVRLNGLWTKMILLQKW